jgi:hypothetical protein
VRCSFCRFLSTAAGVVDGETIGSLRPGKRFPGWSLKLLSLIVHHFLDKRSIVSSNRCALTIINLHCKNSLLQGEFKLADLLAAHHVYGPQLELNPTVQPDQIADWMSMRAGTNTSEAIMVLQELNEAILYFNCQGTPVKLPGIGIFSR